MARKRKPKTKVLADDQASKTVTNGNEKDTASDPTATTTATSPIKVNGTASSTTTTTATTATVVVHSSTKSNFIDDLLPAEPGMRHLSTVRVLLVGAVILSIGTLGFYHLPGMIRNKDDNSVADGHHLVDAFYCATMTLTTIGFGDICPANANPEGKLFLLVFSLVSLGFFCGPVTQLGAAWRHAVPGGLPTVGSFIVGLGVTVFTMAEGLDQLDALYAAVVTGTTIGYGDITPQSDAGKIAVALYAIVSLQAMGMLLDPARTWLEQLCTRAPPQPVKKKTKVGVKQD